MGKLNFLFAATLCLTLSWSVVYAGSLRCPPFDICHLLGNILCRNGGTCTYHPNNCVICLCAPGWTGDKCDLPEPAETGVPHSTSAADAIPEGTTPILHLGLEEKTPDTVCLGQPMCSEGGRCTAGRMSCRPGWGSMARGCCLKCTRDCHGAECVILSSSKSGVYKAVCLCPVDRRYVDGEGCVDICSVYPKDFRCIGRKRKGHDKPLFATDIQEV